MKLTNEQYKEMSLCLGKKINDDTDFELLSLELQKDIHDMVSTLKKLISMNQSLIRDNEQLIEQNEYLLNLSKSQFEPNENRILN